MDANQILLDTHEFDYLILGTGLTDSLFAACLAKTKKKILVLDIDRSYSSSLQTVNLREFHSFFISPASPEVSDPILRKKSIFSGFFLDPGFSTDPPTEYKGYNIDLQPKVLFSTSLTVDLMKEADMDKYMEFRAMSAIFHYDNENRRFLETPSSKGQIFVHKDLSLLEKRTLFKTLQSFINVFHWKHGVKVDPNSTAEFDKTIELDEAFLLKYEQFKQENCLKFLDSLGLQGKVREILLYTLACCEESPETSRFPVSTEELFRRMFKFVKSLGVHSSLPFLYTIYGTGDIPQAFARIAAVYGSIFIINEGVRVRKIEKIGDEFRVFSDIAGERQFFSCKGIIVGMEYQEEIGRVLDSEFLSKNAIFQLKEEVKREYLLRILMIFEGEFNRPVEQREEPEEPENIRKLPLIYVIPPKNELLGNVNPVTLMIFGANTFSCPKGRFLVNVKTVVKEKESDFQGFMGKIREFLLSEVKGKENEWKNVFAGGYLQEKTEGVVGFKEGSGVFLIKNNDFTLDLDNYFKEFVDGIGGMLAEFQGEEKTGFFQRKSKENEEEEEENNGKSEINKLLEKLDNIVLNKESKPENEEIKEENEEKAEKNEEKAGKNEEKAEKNEEQAEKNEEKAEEKTEKIEENSVKPIENPADSKVNE